VAGEPHRAPLLDDRAPHALADPPRGVGRELDAVALIEAQRRLDEADAPFLDQIGQVDAAVGELAPDHRDQPQVGSHAIGGVAVRWLLGP
jgi:hypothetical protein